MLNAMWKFRATVERRRKNKELGGSEIVATLFLTPLVLFIIFALIEMSLYFNTRSFVESQVRDHTRMAAIWGGTGTGEQGVRLNKTGKKVSTLLKTSLYNEGKCVKSNCATAPTVSCVTYRNASGTGTAYNYATNLGQRVACTVRYDYKPIMPGAALLGFGAIAEQDYTIRHMALTETGY